MITVKEAAQKAKEYLLDLMPELEDASIKIAETELSEDEKYWLITLGINEHNPFARTTLQDFVRFDYTNAHYKLFKVNSESGKVDSMKIRKVG